MLTPLTNPDPDPRSDATGREHKLTRPTTALGRAGRAVQNAIERVIAHNSVHGDPPVYDTALFPWVAKIEADWREIRREVESVLVDRDELPAFHEILEEVRTITTTPKWKTFWLQAIGMDCAENRRRCPVTTRLLSTIPHVKTAFFSILAPGMHIPAHRGAYNGLLRYHLGLIVPDPREACRIRIMDGTYTWNEGDSLVFDDTFDHEVWNETSGHRVVLFVDFARPLKTPFHQINLLLLGVGAVAPFLRRAAKKHKDWEQRARRHRSIAAK